MATLRSTRYPNLVISDLGVRFVDGLLHTNDVKVVARARRLGGLGVEVVEDDSRPAAAPVPVRVERREPPRGNASRKAWAGYAASVGVGVSDDMTRNEIRAAVAEVAGDE